MKIYRDLTQKSQEWFDLRRGRICSSDMNKVIDTEGRLRQPRSKSSDMAESVRTYVHQLVAERISGYVDAGNDWASAAMEYGIRFEAAARSALSFQTGLDFQPVGGVLSTCERLWTSSDGIAMSDADPTKVAAIAEIKIPIPKTQVGYLLSPQDCVDEYKPQLAHEMIVSEADRGYLFSYGPGLEVPAPNVLIEVTAGSAYIANLRGAIEQIDGYVLAALRRLGVPHAMLLPPPIPQARPTKEDDATAAREWFDATFGTDEDAKRAAEAEFKHGEVK